MKDKRRVILSYHSAFLPREMLHVYRQVTGIQKFENWVLSRRRENPDIFPFPNLIILKKSPLRLISRFYGRMRGKPVPLSRTETRQMLAIVKEKMASAVHVYLGNQALRALAFLKECPAARIISFHGADLSDEFTPADYEPLWEHGELFLCRSRSLWQSLLAKGCPPEKIRLNYTGVPTPAVPSCKNPPGLKSGEPLKLLQACRFVGKKGLDISLHAVRQLKESGMPVKLTLAGAGEEENRLRSLAEDLGIKDLVNFAGFLTEPELRRAFEENDIFIHPSRTTSGGDLEGIPNALLEAMSWGMPVVSTRHSGIPEAVKDGKSGLLIESADADLLARAVRRLASDEDLFKRISGEGMRAVLDGFSVAACIGKLEAYYAEAIELAAARR